MSQLSCYAVTDDAAPIAPSPIPNEKTQVAGSGFPIWVSPVGRLRRLSSTLKGGPGSQFFVLCVTIELSKRLDMAVRFDTTSAFRADPFGSEFLAHLGISIPSANCD
jgi:hypothetical protein